MIVLLRKGIFFLLFVFIATAKKYPLKIDRQLWFTHLNDSKISAAIKFSLENIYCAQISTDNSLYAIKILKAVHESPFASSVLNSDVSWKTRCTLKILIAETRGNLIKLLKMDLFKGNVLLFLCAKNYNELRYFLQEERKRYFQTASVIMIDCHFQVYEYNEITQNIISQFDVTSESVRKKRIVTNFEGAKLKVGTLNCTIHSQVGPIDETGRPEWINGVELKFFDTLSKKLNFTYDIIIPKGKDDQIGSADEKGEISGGILGLVSDKEIDVAFCGIWLSEFKRKASVQLSSPTTDACLKFIVPRPQPLNSTSFGLFSSLHWIVWIIIICVAIVTAVILKCAAYATIRISEVKNPVMENFTSFEKCLLIIWQTLCSNAPESFANLGPLRHIISWWALFAVVLSTFYSSSLSSHLTQPVFSSKADTFQKLVENDFAWCSDVEPPLHALLNLQDYWQRLWARKLIITDDNSQCEIMKNKHHKLAIFAMEYEGGVVLRAELPCPQYLQKFEVIPQCSKKYHLGFILKENSQYNKVFSYFISVYRERGLFIKDYRESVNEYYSNHKNHRELNDVSKLKTSRSTLTLVNIQAIMYILLIGLILSCFSFIIEIIWFTFKKSSNK